MAADPDQCVLHCQRSSQDLRNRLKWETASGSVDPLYMGAKLPHFGVGRDQFARGTWPVSGSNWIDADHDGLSN
jgi:hypothetical protein